MPNAKQTRPALQLNELSKLDFIHKGSYSSVELINNIVKLVTQDVISVTMNETDLPEGRWDGTLVIRWKRVPKAADVVNHIIGWARADEVSMPDPRTLRLWWD